MITNIQPFLLKMTLISVWSLVLFSFVSLSATALSHILIVLPGVYFLFKAYKDKKLNFSKSSWSLLGIIIVAIFSILNAPDISNKLKMIFKLKYLMLGLLAIYPLRELFKTLKQKQVSTMVKVFLILLAIGNIVGIYALFTQYHPLRMKAASDPWRAAGMYGMAITYGYGLELIFILLVGVAWKLRGRVSTLVNPWIFWVCFLSTTLGFYYSFTRGATLAFIFSLPFLFIKTHKKIFWAVSIAGVVLVLTIVSIVWNAKDDGQNRFLLSAKNECNLIRLSQYEAAVKGWVEKPLLGWGYRNFEPNAYDIKKRNNIDFADFYGHAHNNYLEFLVSTGTLGFLGLVLFVLFWLWEVFQRSDDLGFILVPFVVSFAISGLFQNTINDGENMFVIMFLYSVTQATKNLKVNFSRPSS